VTLRDTIVRGTTQLNKLLYLQIDNRIGIMGSAVANYIRNYLEDGSVVGIVSFSSSATVLADMTKIVDETTTRWGNQHSSWNAKVWGGEILCCSGIHPCSCNTPSITQPCS